MLAKVKNMRARTWTIIGSLVCLSLLFPLFFTGTSLSEKILFDWLNWSKSPEYLGDTLTPDCSGRGSLRARSDWGRNCINSCLLKVYVYDLPRKFNLGMLQRYNSTSDQDLPWDGDEPPPTWSVRSGLRQQHNVEYWLMVDLLDKHIGAAGERAAVRVDHPEDADLLFVPFFSSLSFNKYGNHMRDPEAEKDRILQEEATTLILESKWWQRSGGMDHVIPVHHPNAFRHYRHLLNASIFIVADFGRTPADISSLHKDVVAPYSHVVPTFHNDDEENPFESRTTLLYFQGTIKRKDDGVVRTRLALLLQNKTGVHFEDGVGDTEGIVQATIGMRSSRFCLHPAGDTPSSCRLFDAIVSHCVPVVISDKIELPYEDEVNYTSFVMFFSVDEVLESGFLLERLNNVGKKQWTQMFLNLKKAAKHFEFQSPTKRDDAVNMIWRQLQRKVPAIKLAIHRKQRLKIADWWR